MGTEKPTKAPPRTIHGVTFRCFKAGINRYEWRANDAPLTVIRNYMRTTYRAYWDGVLIGDRFRTEESAMLAAVKARSNRPQARC